MFIKFEGRIINISQIQFIEKFNYNNFANHISIYIHFLSKEKLSISYTNNANRDNAYIKLEQLLVK